MLIDLIFSFWIFLMAKAISFIPTGPDLPEGMTIALQHLIDWAYELNAVLPVQETLNGISILFYLYIALLMLDLLVMLLRAIRILR